MTGDASEHQKMKVFVSYSRANAAFADQIVLQLEDRGFRPMIDRHDIPPGVEWADHLDEMILEADAVVFILTDRSAQSPICANEVKLAKKLAKRMISILPAPLSPGIERPEALARINEIYFYEEPNVPGSGFGKGLIDLSKALREDAGWIRQHTNLSEQSARWESLGRNEDFLLRGEALSTATSWQAEKPDRAVIEPSIIAFLAASADYADKLKREQGSQIAERERALSRARKATTRVRQVLWGSTFTVAILGMVAIWGMISAGRQSQQVKENRSELFAAASKNLIEDGRYSKAALLALQGLRSNDGKNLFDRLFVSDAAILTELLNNSLVMNPQLGIIAGFEGPVEVAVFSTTGDELLTAGVGGAAHLWDVDRRQVIHNFESHRGTIFFAGFLNDRETVYTASTDGKVHVNDLKTGKTTAKYGDYEWLSRLVQPRLTQKVMIGTHEGFLYSLDLKTGESKLLKKGVMSDHGDEPFLREYSVTALAASQDGDLVVSGNRSGDLSLFRMNDAENYVRSFIEIGAPISSAAISVDKKVFAYSTEAGTVSIRDAVSEAEIAHVQISGTRFAKLIFSTNGKYLFAAAWNGDVNAIEVATGNIVRVYGETMYSISDIAIADTISGLITSDGFGVIRHFDLDNEGLRRTYTGHIDLINAIDISPDERRVVSAGLDGTVRLWTADFSAVKFRAKIGNDSVLSVAADTNDQILSAVVGVGLVSMDSDAQNPKVVCGVEPPKEFEDTTLLPLGEKFLFASANHQLTVCDPSSGRYLVSNMSNSGSQVRGLAKFPKSELALIAVSNGYFVLDLRTWQVSERATLFEVSDKIPGGKGSLPTSKAEVISDLNEIVLSAVSEDENSFIFALRDGYMIIVNRRDPTVKEKLRLHSSTIRTMVLSRRGRVLTAADDSRIKVWSHDFVEAELDLYAGPSGIVSAGYLRNEDFIFAVTASGELHIWNSDSGDRLLRFQFSTSAVVSGAYSEAKDEFYIGTRDGAVIAITLPNFVFSSLLRRMTVACRTLANIGGNLHLTTEDALEFPILRSERLLPNNRQYESPCMGKL